MITFGRKLKHLRQKNHLTQKELGMAVGFPDSCADVRIAQYESDVRTPKEDLMKLFASKLGVPVELFTVPVCKLRSNGMPVPLLRNCYSIFNGTKYR